MPEQFSAVGRLISYNANMRRSIVYTLAGSTHMWQFIRTQAVSKQIFRPKIG